MISKPKNIIKKNIEKSFAFIKEVENTNEFRIESLEPSLNNSKAKTYIEDGDFYLAFYTNDILNHEERNTLLESKTTFTLKNKKLNLVFDFKSFFEIETLLMDELDKFNCRIRKYFNPEIKNEDRKYYRVIIPTTVKQEPQSIFQSDSFHVASVTHYRGLVTIKYLHHFFHLYAYRNKETDCNYLIIESRKKTTLSEFKKNIDNILLAYSFVTGYFPRDKRYIISSNDNFFENIYGIMFETIEKSFESGYSVIPKSGLRIFLSLPQDINFPQNIFNRLCLVLYNHTELNRVLFLIVEGHTLSMELRASIYSVAIETLTNIIFEENKTKFVPISDKKISKKIIKELKGIIEKYSTEYDENSKDTLIKKISVINSPTNKQKLLKPFELLNLKLNDREIDAIAKRNDFLHGRLPYNNDKDRFMLQQLALTLLYCVTILVLKYVGYSGYVMYYPSTNELKKKKSISDYVIKMI